MRREFADLDLEVSLFVCFIFKYLILGGDRGADLGGRLPEGMGQDLLSPISRGLRGIEGTKHGLNGKRNS